MDLPQLQVLGDSLCSKLLKSSNKPSKHINYQIALLEVVKYEVKRLDRLGYCDYELAFVCYYITQLLNEECKKHLTAEITDFVDIIDQTLAKQHGKFIAIKQFIIDTIPLQQEHEEDPLLSRFNRLKFGDKSDDSPFSSSLSPSPSSSTSSPSPSSSPSPASSPSSSLDKFKYTEMISVKELHNLLNSQKSVLLIDFRTKNEFNYNHINYRDIVNIEPSIVTSLLSQENNNPSNQVSDQDLEERLRLLLPTDQYTRFLEKHKYDLVVIYNLRYGATTSEFDRFELLIDLIINDTTENNPSKNPFIDLIEILAYRNKYISSRLKRSPCYLSGGVSLWFQTFGQNSIAKTIPSQVLMRPQASLSRTGSDSPSSSRSNSFFSGNKFSSNDSLNSVTNSPYLRNFGDYLGTAKTTSGGSVSSSLLTEPSSHGNSTNNAPYYKPPSSMKPGISSSITKPGAQDSSSIVDETPASNILSQQSPVKSPVKPQLTKSSSMSSTTLGTSSTSTSQKKPNPVKFLEQYTTGLVNLGNSCYMNCILQCLGATPQLTKFFFPTFPLTSSSPAIQQSYRQHINVNNKLGTKGIVTTNFVNLLMNMFGNSGSYFSPLNFKKVIGSVSPGKQYATFDQQDCIEFLEFLLDSLHEDLNQMVVSDAKEKQAIMELTPEQEKTREYLPIRLASTIEWERYLKLNFSIIVDYFQGQYLSQLKCLECGLTSTTYNAFLNLSLPIPQKLNSVRDISLHDCLQEFVQTELLDEDNKWFCPRCKRFTKLTKKINITRLPQVLIIHFKRFKLNPNGYFNKMDTFIKYNVNEVLDLTPYWPDTGTIINLSLDKNQIMSKEKEAQILSTLPTRNQVPPFRYKLYGVANHYGTLTTGHYTAYVHKESDNKKTRGWCYFDDTKVTYNHKEKDVLNQNAYCLFYQRI